MHISNKREKIVAHVPCTRRKYELIIELTEPDNIHNTASFLFLILEVAPSKR